MIGDAAQLEQAARAVPAAAATHARPRRFDGVICFGGEDWWYHNRGHFDMRLMHELSARVPVLYVNSIGMRIPEIREGRMFARRMARKLWSITRGFARIDERFAVYSAVVAPTGVARAVTMPTLPAQVRAAARRMNICRPLIWIACPTAAEIADRWGEAPLVYQRTDRFERFDGVDRHRIARYDAYLKARADLTVFCSSMLLGEEAELCHQPCLLGHGVDYQRFADAGAHANDADEPEDMRVLPRPRAGFIGSIDAHTFDPQLLCDVARRLPDVHFPLIGGCSLPPGWCDAPNVTLLGRKPYEQVHRYMAACDVLIMPWARNTWIEACNPVKLKEYLATGRPVVSTPFPELKRFGKLVAVADNAGDYADAIHRALSEARSAPAADLRRAAVRDETWSSKGDALVQRLRAIGVVPAGLEPDHASMSRDSHPPTRVRPAAAIEVKSFGPRDVPGETRATAPAAAAEAPARRPAETNPFAACRRAVSRRSYQFPQIQSSEPPAAVILLAGGLRPTPLVAAAGCSVLDLWLTPQRTVLGCWIDALRCIPGVSAGSTPVRIISSASSPPPWPCPLPDVDLAYEEEPKRFRGVAGLLHDLSRAHGWHGHLLIVEAGRIALADLSVLWSRHVRSGADVTVGCNRAGTPAGVYAVRSGCFDHVPSVGYTDLKEQLLEGSALDVRAWGLVGPGTLPLRNRREFLTACALLNGQQPATLGPDPARGEGRSIRTSGGRYGLVMAGAGAQISSSATVIDSAVMPGCVVGEGACIVRSVLCGGTRIQDGTDIADVIAGPRAVVADPGGCVPV